MAEWWNEMIVFQQVLFVIGAATTAFLIFQIIMMIVGVGHDSFDSDVTFSHDFDDINHTEFGQLFGLRVLSVRGAIAFLCIGSWVTFTLCYVMHVGGAIPIGVVAGIGAAFAVAALMKSLEKLEADGTLNIKNCVDKIADVYLTIPAKREGSGKVNVFVQERLAEFDAVTDEGKPLKTGEKVKVTGVVNEGTLVVAKA